MLKKVLEGTAEIFGEEMSTFKTYQFNGEKKFAIYTWHGCKLKVFPTFFKKSNSIIRSKLINPLLLTVVMNGNARKMRKIP